MVVSTRGAWKVQELGRNGLLNIQAILPSSKIESARSKVIKLEHKAVWGM
jgi:hypothetical protein